MRFQDQLLIKDYKNINMQNTKIIIQQYHAHPKQPNILVHYQTQKQIQKHLFKINRNNITRQCALTQARISNKQINICKALHYNISETQSPTKKIPNQQVILEIYTEVMLPLQNWKLNNLLIILQTLIKLVAIHGPFRLNQQMIGQNTHGQILVWISQNPAWNYPDQKYYNQEQTLADFVSIVTKHHPQMSEYVFKCRRLKQALQLISKIIYQDKNKTQTYQYINRPSQTEQNQKPAINFKKQITTDFLPVPHSPLSKQAGNGSYRNVFGEAPETKKSLTELGAFKATKNYQHQANRQKPVSNVNQFQKISNNFFQNDKQISKSHSKYRTKPDEEANDNFRSGSNHPGVPQKTKSFYQFQASKHNPNTFGAKTQPKTPTNKSRQPPFLSFNAKNEKGKVDITIINNNVNNYINNVTHQHLLSNQQKQPQNNTYQRPSQPQYQASFHQQKESFQFKQQSNIPNNTNIPEKSFKKQFNKDYDPSLFLKKKTSQQVFTKKPQEQKKLQRMLTLKTQKTQTFAQFSKTTQSHRNSQKLFTFFKDEDHIRHSPFKKFQKNVKKQFQTPNRQVTQYSPFQYTPKHQTQYIKDQVSKVPGCQTPKASFGTLQPNAKKNSKQMHIQSRTKTTDFFNRQRPDFGQKNFVAKQQQKFMKKSENINVQTQDNNKIIIQESFFKTKEQVSQNDSKNSDKKQKPKAQLKKQLRLEFKSLLGQQDRGSKPEIQPQLSPKARQSQINRSSVMEEGALKDKIKQKQTEFAQLKKEALTLLTDIL